MNRKLFTALCVKALCTGALTAIAVAPLSAFAQTFTYTGGTGGAIPDGNAAGISSTINVVDRFALTDFSAITITGLTHKFLGDLTVTLLHGGKTVDIFDRVIGDGATDFGDPSNLSGDYTFVTTGGADFNAAAAAGDSSYVVPSNVNYATVPVGNTNPQGGVSSANGLLSDFVGTEVRGEWTLNISDRESGDTGSFTGWRFTVADPSHINTNRTISDNSLSNFFIVRVGNSSNTDVTLAAGALVQNVQAFNASRLYVTGGTATSLRAEDTAKLYINNGTVSGTVTATESSTVFLNGGSVARVVTTGDAKAYVLAGTFGSVSASGNSDIFVYGGGSVGGATFAAVGGASISLFGDNLFMNAASKTFGTFGGNSGFFYDLAGTLTDGTSLIGSRFFDADGGLSVVGENPGALFLNGVAVVPESSTVALLCTGLAAFGIGIIRRKK